MKRTRAKYKSKAAAVENVKKLFSTAQGKDEISLQEAFNAWGRPEGKDFETNKLWLSTKLTALKFYNLVTPIYSFSEGRRKLHKIQLTIGGKRALGRLEEPLSEDRTSPNNGIKSSISEFDRMMQLVAKWEKNNPEYDVKFIVKLKGETPVSIS